MGEKSTHVQEGPQIVGMHGCVSGYVGGYGSITIAVVYTNISGCVPPTHQISEVVSLR